jgi:hypothetical protein
MIGWNCRNRVASSRARRFISPARLAGWYNPRMASEPKPAEKKVGNGWRFYANMVLAIHVLFVLSMWPAYWLIDPPWDDSLDVIYAPVIWIEQVASDPDKAYAWIEKQIARVMPPR